MTKVTFAPPPPDQAGLIMTGGVVRAGVSQMVTGADVGGALTCQGFSHFFH